MERGEERRGYDPEGEQPSDEAFSMPAYAGEQPSDEAFSAPAYAGERFSGEQPPGDAFPGISPDQAVARPIPSARPVPPARRGAEAPTGGVAATGRLKWFKSDKGFGFVELSDGSGDAFLHATALERSGHADLPPGTTLKVTVGNGQRGRQVFAVTGIDTSTADTAHRLPGGGRGPAGPTTKVVGAVKWYDVNKGFGFVEAADGGRDVFFHANAMRESGLTYLEEGRRVEMDVRVTPKGREASTIRVA